MNRRGFIKSLSVAAMAAKLTFAAPKTIDRAPPPPVEQAVNVMFAGGGHADSPSNQIHEIPSKTHWVEAWGSDSRCN